LGFSEQGCATTDDGSAPWCYVKDTSCPTSSSSSVWDHVAWRDCEVDASTLSCSIKGESRCTKASGSCKWDAYASTCVGASDAVHACSSQWGRQKCARKSGCQWAVRSSFGSLPHPAPSSSSSFVCLFLLLVQLSNCPCGGGSVPKLSDFSWFHICCQFC
jgi:hypothetical protein